MPKVLFIDIDGILVNYEHALGGVDCFERAEFKGKADY